MALAKNDFIEIEFTGSSNGEVFDTTDKVKAKELGLEADVKPMKISIGNHMILQGLDDDLIGKEVGKTYSVKLSPEKGFGKRDPKMIKTVPIKVFHEREINPVRGMAVQLDNYIARILSVSGGRVSVDFNNPMAGKDLDYEFKILRKIEDDKEKVESLIEFFLRQKSEFKLIDKKVIFNDEKIAPFIQIFAPKFKEITGLDFQVENKEKKEVKKEDKK